MIRNYLDVYILTGVRVVLYIVGVFLVVFYDFFYDFYGYFIFFVRICAIGANFLLKENGMTFNVNNEHSSILKISR